MPARYTGRFHVRSAPCTVLARSLESRDCWLPSKSSYFESMKCWHPTRFLNLLVNGFERGRAYWSPATEWHEIVLFDSTIYLFLYGAARGGSPRMCHIKGRPSRPRTTRPVPAPGGYRGLPWAGQAQHGILTVLPREAGGQRV